MCIVGLNSASAEYSEKVSSKSSSEKTLHTLGWTVDELSRLNQSGRQLTVEIQQVLQTLKREGCTSNIPSRVHVICESTTPFLKGMCIMMKMYKVDTATYMYTGKPMLGTYRHRRIAATHVLAILISPDSRKRKPYALPVQLIPYVGLSSKKMRS